MIRALILRRVLPVAVGASIILGLAATRAVAVDVIEEPLDRAQVIARARSWTNAKVPYSQTGYRGGYRRDCSGFVSYAWDLPENLVTWRIPMIAKRISGRELKPGDVLLNSRSGPGARHVVIFERWANRARTKYVGLECTGQDGVDRAVRRVLPYPYRVQKYMYKPYRYVGMAGYYKNMPRSRRIPVRGYQGRVTTPERVAAIKAAAASEKRAQEAAASAALTARLTAERAVEVRRKEAGEQTRRQSELALRLMKSAQFMTGGLAAMLMTAEPAEARNR